MESISTIAITRTTRDELKMFAHKGQTYDEIIRELLEQRREGNRRNRSRDSLDRRFETLQSSESRRP